MVHLSVIEARISQLGVKLSRWFKAELHELQHILMEHEKIVSVVPGRYFAGYALLVATDQRLLLIDKRALFLTVEDIRYDMISQIDFNVRLFDATIQIFTINKQHRFTSMKYRQPLRELISYVQQQVTNFRQYGEVGSNNSFESRANPVANVVYRNLAQPTPTRFEHRPQDMGAAAIWGTHRINPNPYTRSSFSMKNQSWLINV